MEHGRRNIIAGGIVIFIAAIGGFALGFTVENIFKDGIYAMTLPRMLIKAWHSHGMPMAFYPHTQNAQPFRVGMNGGLKFSSKMPHPSGWGVGVYNLIIGVMVDRLALTEKGKKYLSMFTLGAFIMPLGLLLRGLAGGSMAFAPVVLIGAVCFIASAAVMLKGAIAGK